VVIEAVLPSRFSLWVRQRPFQILFLGQSVATVRRSQVAVAHLELDWPNQIGAGWMARDSVPSDEWWSRHWVGELGPVRPLPPASGVWLFFLGQVAGHHPCHAPSTDETAWRQVRQYLAERIRLKSAVGADGTEWTRSTSSGASSRSSELPRASSRSAEPYEVLEVSPDAPDDEVKSAYRTALKLNHPDRVAHLSRQIQAFAHERTQLIVAAWQAIKAERGIR
jgi:hypothetical protein